MKRLTRRRFILGVGATAVAGAVAPAIRIGGVLNSRAEGATRAQTKERQWALVIDLRKCDGCESIARPPQCTIACQEEHFVLEGQEWIKVFEVRDEGGGTYFLPRPCMHCENAPCTNVCPVGASYHDETGVVLVDHRRCIGCRLCMAACPYGARSFNWDEPVNPPNITFAEYTPEYPVPHRRGTVEKCMLCAHRTDMGKLPACVEGCPMGAIYLGDLVEDIATNGIELVKLSKFVADNSGYRVKEDLGTRPRVYYIPGHGHEFGRMPE